MSSVGPTLPPDLLAARRRRQQERPHATQNTHLAFAGDQQLSEDPLGSQSADPRISDDLESRAQARAENQFSNSINLDKAEKKETDEETDDGKDEDDDDVGPMLPGASDRRPRRCSHSGTKVSGSSTINQANTDTASRPDWMLVPPSSTDWTNNVDTTNLKSRGFATSRPGRPIDILEPSSITASKWTSVPGSATNTTISLPSIHERETRRADLLLKRDQDQRMKALQHDQSSSRGASLFDQHNDKRRRLDDQADNPANRPFDRERDIGSSTSLKKTKQIAHESKNLSSMFDTGKFL